MHAASTQDVKEDFYRHLVRLETYVSVWNADPENAGHGIRANPQALYLAVKSSHDDIARYKSYHLADPRNGLSNAVKLSAYLCKWIARFKVVELLDAEAGVDHEDVTAVLLNGAFALNTCTCLIGAELRTLFYYSEKYYDEFQYDLLYREIGEDGLLHIFQMIFTAVGLRRAGVLEFDDPEVATSVFNDEA